MNFMMYGLPVLAAVKPGSEVAHIIERSGGGWVVDSSQADLFPRKVAELLDRPDEVQERALAAIRYAREHFSPAAFVDRFESLLTEVAAAHRAR
jgi:glycosyltransferase involved in cell wall biosynthesis